MPPPPPAHERGLLGFLRTSEAEITIAINNAMTCHPAGNIMPTTHGGFGTLTSAGRDALQAEALLAAACAALRSFACVGETGAPGRVHDPVAAELDRITWPDRHLLEAARSDPAIRRA